ncbi:MAG TPA: HD domain-containing protein, partial [bacterium]|nr:HD domain-containing protein [bacterium]
PDMRIAVNSIAGWVYKNNKSLFIRDARAIKYYTPEIDGLYIRGAAMIVPVSGKGKVSGIIAVTKEKGKYNRDDLYLLTILSNHLAASLETARLYADVKRDYINSIYALAAAVDAKDHYTHGHSATVMKYATKAAERMKLPQGEVEDIKYAALLHDIGKIGISETIINKPGKLTNEEYSIIKMHPQLGANIISKIESLKKLVPLVLSHHEWYNGAGYPLGLRGEEIPVGARIIALADAHSTITSKRPYREERSLEFALKELSRCAGTQFDPAVTGIFIEMLKEEAREQEDELKKQKRDKKAAAEEQINEQDKKRRLRVKFDRNMKRQGDVKGDKEFYS